MFLDLKRPNLHLYLDPTNLSVVQYLMLKQDVTKRNVSTFYGMHFPFGQIAAREHIVLPYDSHCVFAWAQVVVSGIG